MNSRGQIKRVLLKLSGESISGGGAGIRSEECQRIASGIKALRDAGIQVGVVIGAGNIFRGLHASELGIPQVPADYMGMLGTLINGIALEHSLSQQGCPARTFSALECPKAVDSYSWKSANEALDGGTVAIFVGGTGNPFFTTDTAAALRASEVEAGLLVKATKVDGVYDKDPLCYPDAVKYKRISYSRALSEKLQIMDAASIALCRTKKIPILVFDMKMLVPGTIEQIDKLIETGTLIDEGEKQ